MLAAAARGAHVVHAPRTGGRANAPANHSRLFRGAESALLPGLRLLLRRVAGDPANPA
jgi:hypothetical protein